MDAYTGLRSEYEGVGGAYLADVHQWPGAKTGYGGPFFPVQLTHGDVVSWSKSRVATGMEHLCAQGYHVLPTRSGFMSPLAEYMQSLPEAVVKELSGNGWCLPVLAAWSLYVWAHCIRLPLASPSADLAPALLESLGGDFDLGSEGREQKQDSEHSDEEPEEDPEEEHSEGAKEPGEEDEEEPEEDDTT